MAENLSPEECRAQYVALMGAKVGKIFYGLHSELSWAHLKWQQYRSLFGSKTTVALLNETAPAFFGSLQAILRDDLLLHLARLTGRAATGSTQSNLSLEQLRDAFEDRHLCRKVNRLLDGVKKKTAFARRYRRPVSTRRRSVQRWSVPTTPTWSTVSRRAKPGELACRAAPHTGSVLGVPPLLALRTASSRRLRRPSTREIGTAATVGTAGRTGPWEAMGYLDEILPVLSREALEEILQRPAEDRPTEDLFFEFKGAWTPQKVAKSVAAFANALGGFILIGATADANNRLAALPGIDSGRDWAKLIADNIVGLVSPLPVWQPFMVESPTDPEKVVLIVRVEESRRPPHILTKTGHILQRSPGGTSDPIKDRASLDVLIERGRKGDRLVEERARSLQDAIARPPQTEWIFSCVSVPIPYASARVPDLLTRDGQRRVAELFGGPSVGQASLRRMVENGYRFEAGDVRMCLFDDGAVHIWVEGTDRPQIPLEKLCEVVRIAVGGQSKMSTSLREVRVLLSLQGCSGRVLLLPLLADPVALTTNGWSWEEDTTTSPEAITRLTTAFRRRLLRWTGQFEFDE